MDTNDILRLLIVVLLVLHALSHVLWFLASWTRFDIGFGDDRWVLLGDVTLKSWVGRIIGIIAIVVMVMLFIGAFALLTQEPWWRGAARWGVLLSFIVVVPWWPRVPHHIGLQAIIANIVLMFAIALPLSIEILGEA
jgi:hypothetical protein